MGDVPLKNYTIIGSTDTNLVKVRNIPDLILSKILEASSFLNITIIPTNITARFPELHQCSDLADHFAHCSLWVYVGTLLEEVIEIPAATPRTIEPMHYVKERKHKSIKQTSRNT